MLFQANRKWGLLNSQCLVKDFFFLRVWGWRTCAVADGVRSIADVIFTVFLVFKKAPFTGLNLAFYCTLLIFLCLFV